MRNNGTIEGYDAARTRRSSVSDDPETPSGGDDSAAVDQPTDGERSGAGSDGTGPTDATWGDEANNGDADGDVPDTNEGDELFEEDFASAFGGGDSGGGGDGPSEFDARGTGESAKEFESDIPRIDMGIDGLDEMIRGGVPERSLIAVIGSAGTGKTTVGLQFLHQALRENEKAIFIALEESREAVLDTAAEKGWGFEGYWEEDKLAIVDLDPVEMATSLTGIRSELPRLIDEFDASRVVLDSVSLLETMYDDPAKRRTEIFAFARSLKEAGVTTLLTSEASEDTAYASRYGIVEYLTDAVFVLQYVRPSDFQETRLAVEIQKIRNASHSRETKPYEITDDGISVYGQANIF